MAALPDRLQHRLRRGVGNGEEQGGEYGQQHREPHGDSLHYSNSRRRWAPNRSKNEPFSPIGAGAGAASAAQSGCAGGVAASGRDGVSVPPFRVSAAFMKPRLIKDRNSVGGGKEGVRKC